MSRISYVNGNYIPHYAASVHIEDRGYQFSDGVYDVIAIYKGQLIDFEGHLFRLERSLKELEISWPVTSKALKIIVNQIIRLNRIRDGILYLQITRGVAPRDHIFPDKDNSALIVTARQLPPFNFNGYDEGINIMTTPEIRWKRCDIKSVSLLGNCLAKEKARRNGCYEAWFVDNDGMITEGTTSNAWIINNKDQLITRNANNAILNGITRLSIINVAKKNNIKFYERAFSLEEAKLAKEVFITSTTSFVKPVLKIDQKSVGNGKVGSLTIKLLSLYENHIKAQIA